MWRWRRRRNALLIHALNVSENGNERNSKDVNERIPFHCLEPIPSSRAHWRKLGKTFKFSYSETTFSVFKFNKKTNFILNTKKVSSIPLSESSTSAHPARRNNIDTSVECFAMSFAENFTECSNQTSKHGSTSKLRWKFLIATFRKNDENIIWRYRVLIATFREHINCLPLIRKVAW